ncbi:uncharacterized protein TNCV_2107821 [Trichonephila clavipes]|nr:uncharacterized protein TNCV_2107821 [Trichonephila clavipes]
MEVTRVVQRAYIKIAVLQGRNAMECHSELMEVLGNNSLPYHTVARRDLINSRRFATQEDIANAVHQQVTLFTHSATNAEAAAPPTSLAACGDSSRGLHWGSLDQDFSCQLHAYCVGILLHREGHIALYTTVIN